MAEATGGPQPAGEHEEDDEQSALQAEPEFASIRGDGGLVSLSRARGTLSAGPREVPLRSIGAVDVRGGRGEKPFEASIPLGVEDRDRVVLVTSRAFGPVRECAVAFARVAEVPIVDATLGPPTPRRWEDWSLPLRARLERDPVEAPLGPSPGDDLAAGRQGDVLTVWMTAGSVFRTMKRLWRRPRPETSLLGWFLLPVGLVFLVALLPVLAVLVAVLSVAVRRRYIALEVSPREVGLRGFVVKRIPADEVRDVEIRWDVASDGSAHPDELVVRSDRETIAFHGAGEAELGWLRTSVRAALAPKGR